MVCEETIASTKTSSNCSYTALLTLLNLAGAKK
jgi:hypothetical protein